MKKQNSHPNTLISSNTTGDLNMNTHLMDDKSIAERLRAASIMTAEAYGEPDLMKMKLDRTVFSMRNQSQD